MNVLDQHEKMMAKCGADYFAGCISKHIYHFPSGGGMQALQKAMHYIEKADEMGVGGCRYPMAAGDWINSQNYAELSVEENCYMRQVLHAVLVGHNMLEAKKHLEILMVITKEKDSAIA